MFLSYAEAVEKPHDRASEHADRTGRMMKRAGLGSKGGLGPRAAKQRSAAAIARPAKASRGRAKKRICLGCGVLFVSKGIHNRQCEECAARPDWPPTGWLR